MKKRKKSGKMNRIFIFNKREVFENGKGEMPKVSWRR
jgi:hypothetical protein